MSESVLKSSEPLCDLQMVKAEYDNFRKDGGITGPCFRIAFTTAKQHASLDVPEIEGELFAAELEALAAIIRSRVIRARIRGEEQI